MKPNFALDFRDDAIALLHRTARGWLLVGEVALDTADLAEALGYLRASALVLSPQGFTTKLILPNSQILYTEVEASAPDATSRRARVRAALDGLTPYTVDELVFDIWGQGDRVQVAVIARETLAEAEAFATQHRFNPVSLVALPPPGKFGGEPFFGPTEGASAFLPPGESVSRDQDPVTVVGRARDAETAPTAETATPETAKPETAKPESQAKPEAAAPAPPPAAQPTPAPKAAEPKAPEPQSAEPATAADAEPAAPAPAASAEGDRHKRRETRRAERAAENAAPAVAAAPPAKPDDPASEATQAAAPAPLPTADEPVPQPPAAAEPEPAADAKLGMPDAEPPAKPPEPVATRTAAADPVPDAPPSLAFSSRRREEAAATRREPPMAPPKAPVAPSRTPAAAAPPVAAAPVTMLRNSGSAEPAAEPALAARANNVTPLPIPPKPAPPKVQPFKAPPSKPAGLAAAMARNRPTLVTADTLPVDKPARRADARPAALQAVPPGAAAKPSAPTGIGARSPRRATRGKPRYLGLILTAVLLLLLTLVAVWSSYYLSQEEGAPEAPVQAAGIPPAEATAAPVAPPPLEVTAGDAVDLPEPAAIAPPTVAEPEVAAATPEAEAAPPPEPEPAPAAPPPSGLAAGEVARATVPGAAAQDEIFLSTAEAVPPAFDAVALPAPVAAPDPAPGAQMPPPPFGTVYQFDEDGRIVATATGVVTPEGVWLIAARPPVIPPPRPAQAAPEPAAAAADSPAPETGAAAAVPAPEAPAPGAFVPDATAADSRPRTRPADLAPPPQATTPEADPQQAEDDAALSAATGTRFASTRPRPRSAAVAALAPPPAAQQAALGSLVGASGGLLQISPRPAARPQDFSRAVQAAVAAASVAVANPPKQQGGGAAPSIAPEEEDEPEVVATAAPRIPSRASVAKQATFVNAINLSKLNLIGIYGTASNRYALIRTAAGRYDKVKVGDRIDGGRVAAITGSELRYQKSGRMVTLAMPRS